MMSLGDVEPIDGDSILTTATNATNATVTSMKGEGQKGRPKGKSGPKNKRQMRGKPSAKETESKQGTEEPNLSSMDTNEETEARQPAKRTRKKAAESFDGSQMESVISAKPQPAKKAGGRKKAEDITLPEPENEPEHRLSEDASQLISELMEATDPAEAPRVEPSRGTKRTSDGMPKAESSLVMLDEAPSQMDLQEKQPKRSKKGAKQMAITSEEAAAAAAAEPSSLIEQSISTQTTTVPKPKRGRKPKQTKQQEESQILFTNPSSEQPSDPPPQPKSPSPPHREAEEKAAPEPQKSLQATTPKRLSHNAFAKAITPSPSPQSSDAENKPPSSRPSIPLSQQRPTASSSSHTRTPLAPTTPIRSPSKRNVKNNNNIINGGLATTHPWQPVDLERVFLPSPHSKAANLAVAVAAADGNNKENLALSTIDTQENRSLEQVVKEVKARLTSPEKQMSVEEWICFNAKRGESRMRDECERLVSIFETEGGKAMRALEGIECVQ